MNDPKPFQISHANGINFYTTKGEKFTDFTGGFTSHAILGWSQKKIAEAIYNQLMKIPHIDYKAYSDSNRDELANLLISKAESNLNKVFFVGSSGGEACEVAMKLSYQHHFAKGNNKKTWFISREQSYHGSTSHSMGAGDRPNLNFYKPLFPQNMAKIPEHNVYRCKKRNEDELSYTDRCVNDLETKILEIGPENVAGFIGETICGGLTGDVPPTKDYWYKIKNICLKYDIHLILDEVWCGTGTSGKIYCIDWDNVNPDFVFLGKTLGAGYSALSAVITNSKITDAISSSKQFNGVVQYSNTHQGHSASVAGALEAQKIIHDDIFLDDVTKKGVYLRNTLNNELKSNPFFFNTRGRGLRNSLEYKCVDQHLFGLSIAEEMKEKYKIIISGKWHRVGFAPALTVTWKEIDFVLEKFISTFNKISKNWSKVNREKVKLKNFF